MGKTFVDIISSEKVMYDVVRALMFSIWLICNLIFDLPLFPSVESSVSSSLASFLCSGKNESEQGKLGSLHPLLYILTNSPCRVLQYTL